MKRSTDKYIKVPGFPKGRVTAAIIGEDYPCFAQELQKLGIRLYVTKRNDRIDPCAACHADMAAHVLKNGCILVEKTQTALADALIKDGFTVLFTEREAAGKYPNDVLLNSFSVSGTLICKKSAADSRLTDRYERLIDVKQGYAKCSVFPVRENAFITDDTGIYKALMSLGADCLLIQKGGIYLDGIHDGFIGGSGFLYDEHTAVFFGNIEAHPEGDKLLAFLHQYEVNAFSLREEPLTDIGGVLPLTEKFSPKA